MRDTKVREVPPVRDALDRVRCLALERGHATGCPGDNEIADTVAGRGHCSPLTWLAGVAGASRAGVEHQEIVDGGTIGSPARCMYGRTISAGISVGGVKVKTMSLLARFSRPARQPKM